MVLLVVQNSKNSVIFEILHWLENTKINYFVLYSLQIYMIDFI